MDLQEGEGIKDRGEGMPGAPQRQLKRERKDVRLC